MGMRAGRIAVDIAVFHHEEEPGHPTKPTLEMPGNAVSEFILEILALPKKLPTKVIVDMQCKG
jgi:hypothetical protein